MPIPVIIAGAITWCGSVWAVVQPLIPGTIVISGWTVGSHLVSFGGSWLSARWYSKNCVGEGLRGMYQSYWKMGSPVCMSLLVSHVALLAIAVTSIVCTIIIFLWMWYSTFKKIIWPIKTMIHTEFTASSTTKKHRVYKDSVKIEPGTVIDLTNPTRVQPQRSCKS